jgi:autoinducer 2-degrading protein
MIVQVVYLEVQSDQLEAFITETLANAQASLKEPGVIQFDLLQQADNQLKFMLYEAYQTAEDIDAHRQTPHFKHWREVCPPMLSSERFHTLYQKVIRH